MRTTLLASLLLLAACGGGGGVHASDDVVVTLVSFADLNPDFDPSLVGVPQVTVAGETEYGEPTTIRAVDTGDAEAVAQVIAHELWHAAGFPEHSDEPGCISQPMSPLLLTPCPNEVAQMATVRRTFILRPEAQARAATMRAADFWNDALGRVMFVLEP